jgi:4-methylaminobutanoate oxidase (formaldehyde-forming)
MQEHARVAVIGAGIAGASVAYHLARLGVRDIVVLEQGKVVGGTTAHAPGLVGQLRSSVSLTKMLMYSVSLYRNLSLDGVPGFQEAGSLRLASSKERMQELRRQEGFAKAVGLEAYLLTPSEVSQISALLNTAGMEGALYVPRDGSATATILARVLLDEAMQQGVSVHPQTRVTGIEIHDGRVRAVTTSAGRVSTESIVIAAGIWSPLLGRLAGVWRPLTPMQHQYAMTPALPELRGYTVPNVRDPDKLVYFRQQGDALVLGGYERNPEAVRVDALPRRPDPTTMPFDADRFAPLLRAGQEMVPFVARYGLAKQVNGLEAFTPDGEFLLGRSPNVQGLWAACGFCAHGISGAGGVGKMMAEWIVEGEPSLDLWHMDLRRIGSYAGSISYVQQRATEICSTYYDISYPLLERSSVRNLRLSPLHAQFKELGAVFGEKAGWERPNWFTTNRLRSGITFHFRGWPSANWSPAISAEHQAARERAALFDMTSFSKLEVGGPGALEFLQHLTANEMNKPIGSITYTQMLNERGGIECDLTVTRLEPDRFLLITGAAFGTHDLGWIRQHLPDGGAVYAHDVSSSFCTIGLWGPHARAILQRVTDEDVSNTAFPYLTARQLAAGPIPVLALRVTYVGELGWELYTPAEYGQGLWQTLWDAGQEFGVAPAGYRAIESLRLEKGYRYWSADIHGEYNPYEAGLSFAVRLNKGDFIGREALLRVKESGPSRKLCLLTLEDPTAIALGNEPIMDGERVLGRVTSGGYGYTMRQSLAYGYLPVECARLGTTLDIQWFGERIGATIRQEPLYDPASRRVRA